MSITAQILSRREEGKTYEQIARALKIGYGQVFWTCVKHGAENPNRPPNFYKGPKSSYLRNGKIVRPFSEEEDTKIVLWAKAGKSQTEIARILLRKPSSIMARLVFLARHEENPPVPKVVHKSLTLSPGTIIIFQKILQDRQELKEHFRSLPKKERDKIIPILFGDQK